MKKKNVFLGLLVCLLATGLMFVGCDSGSSGDGNNLDPKTITITGLSGMASQVGLIVSSDFPDFEWVAAGTGFISNNSVSIQLENAVRKPDGSYTGNGFYTGSGSYYLILTFSSSGKMWVYINGKTATELGISLSSSSMEEIRAKTPKYNISSVTSSIDFRQFSDTSTW